jgi:hypothetical protein
VPPLPPPPPPHSFSQHAPPPPSAHQSPPAPQPQSLPLQKPTPHPLANLAASAAGFAPSGASARADASYQRLICATHAALHNPLWLQETLRYTTDLTH